MSETQVLIQQDAKSTANEHSDRKASLVRQCLNLLLLMLKLKAGRAIFLVLPISLTLSSLWLPSLLGSMTAKPNDGEAETGLKFYGTSDLASSGQNVLVDSVNFPTEANAIRNIMTDRGGHADWLMDCTPDVKCRAKLISESDASIIAYIRYSNTGSKRATLECLSVVQGFRIRCAFLYHLMAQSISKNSVSGGVFRDVQFFTLSKSTSDKIVDYKNGTTSLTLPESICAKWIHEGLFLFHMTRFTRASIALMSIGVAFYFLVTTVSNIRTLKTNGFFQQLVRSGLSPASYWTIVWLITILECTFFSSIMASSHILLCPGVYPVGHMINVFLLANFHCLTLAAITILLELLIPSILAISMLIMVMIIAIIFAFLLYADIVSKLPGISAIFTPIHAHHYIMDYMVSDILRQQSGQDPVAEKPEHYQHILLSTCLAALFLAMLTVYLDFLVRAGNGLCLPSYYPFRWNFWHPQGGVNRGAAVTDSDAQQTEPHIEPLVGFSPSIIVDRVSKAYKSCCSVGPRVLNELSCKIYKDQITALIGHNGAGKSTLMRILAGEECPDTGAAYINGIKVTDPFERLALRGSIGICPQFDVLCGELTVIESIRVTLNCQGLSSDTEVKRARVLLRRLGLGDKENVMSTDLSGGQKRKVNAILALLGDPCVVFLDEPTSGLDPVSRRQLWQLLQEEKFGRSIVLCTQFMDEADILADRKIFLCGGQIVCAGSSMFLKRAFGCNFTLSVSLNSKSDTAKLMSRLKHVQLKTQFETELQLEVPAARPSALVEAVQVLESSQDIEAFGLSQATLDGIFMKLSGVSSAEIIGAFRSGELANFLNKTEKDLMTQDRAELLESQMHQSERLSPSVFKQFAALFRLNLRRQVRTRSNIWSRFVTPAVLLAAMGLVATMTSSGREEAASSEDEDLTKIDGSHRDSMLNSHDYEYMKTICIHDGPLTPGCNESCAILTGPGYPPELILSKPQSTSLRSFLAQNTTVQSMQSGCWSSNLAYSDIPCIIYYASSWNQTEHNKQRDIAIGVLHMQAEHVVANAHMFPGKDILQSCRKAFRRASLLFGAGEIQNDTELAIIKPFSQFSSTDVEMMLFLWIFGLFPVSYLSDPMEDISSRVRGHLVSMGMTHVAYWINTFLLHWIQYTVCFTVAILLLCTSEKYRNAYFIRVCLPTLFIGTASNQMTVYTIATIARTRNTAVSLSCNFGAVFIPIIFTVLSSKGSAVMVLLICLLPPVAPISIIHFSMNFAKYSLDYYKAKHVSDLPDLYSNCWSNVHILLSLIVMPIHIAIMCCIIALAENRSGISASLCRRKNPAAASDMSVGAMDQGAQKETDRVLGSIRNPQNVLEVRHLCKTYPNGVSAVRCVTFATVAGEIFGLLGANGAGKTTSMSAIVGEESATSGECEVRMKDGAWVSGRRSASVGAIGYCPQHNPLFDCITVAEHLRLYAEIRGLPSAAAERQIGGLIQGLGLSQHRDKCSTQLSGGNKRRLCLAIALLGDPALIVVDEASTGVDPENKRFIWGAIRGMLHGQRSVLVTTHSMEEVEALCSRVGIMNKGQMIAFGTVQQLRSRYGDAYTLDVLMKQEADEKRLQQKKAAVKSVIAAQFKRAVVLEELSLCMQFFVPKKSVTRLSSALQWLAANQGRLGVDYYLLYQMSLDQVFVKLVKQFDKSSGTE